MSLKIFTYPNSYRVQKSLIAAQYVGVDIECPKFELGKDNKTEEFKKKNPLQKVPVLETPQGNIFESNAIARYVARLRTDAGLLGGSSIEQAQVDQWIDFSQNEFEPARAAWLYQVLGYIPVNQKALGEAKKECENALKIVNEHLLHNTFMVGNRVTLADITLFAALVEPMQKLFAPAFLKNLGNLVRWFSTLANQAEFAAVVGKVEFAKEEAQPKGGKEEKKAAEPKKEAPKKEEKKEAPKAAAPAATEEEDEDGVPREKKAKSILDSLPESPMGHIDTTKKLMFSVRPILPTFFEQHFPTFDDKGYVWFTCNYNYNDENKVFYMTGNAVGGFIQRSDAARKYALGVMNILGNPDEETPPFPICGAWMFRGTEIPREMLEENPDSEYYTWKKIDVSKPEGQALIKEQFMSEKLNGIQVLDRRFFK